MSQEVCAKKFKRTVHVAQSVAGRRFIVLTLLLVVLWGVGYGRDKDKNKDQKDQPRSDRDKPVLIREPEKPEGAPEGAPDPPKELNPARAEQILEIGNYYFKRKRYDAAIGRYKEALQYKPDYWEAYKLLAKAYEKKNEWSHAIDIYETYLVKFPNSGFTEESRKELQRLRKKAESTERN